MLRICATNNAALARVRRGQGKRARLQPPRSPAPESPAPRASPVRPGSPTSPVRFTRILPVNRSPVPSHEPAAPVEATSRPGNFCFLDLGAFPAGRGARARCPGEVGRSSRAPPRAPGREPGPSGSLSDLVSIEYCPRIPTASRSDVSGDGQPAHAILNSTGVSDKLPGSGPAGGGGPGAVLRTPLPTSPSAYSPPAGAIGCYPQPATFRVPGAVPPAGAIGCHANRHTRTN